MANVRTGENKRESWWVRNLTKKTIAIGDLLLVPAIKPGKRVDLLHYYSREKVSHSTVLTSLVKARIVSLSKDKIFTNDFPGNISTTEVDEAITPAEENEAGGGGTGVHNELTGLQGGVIPDEFYHLSEIYHNALPSLMPPPAPDLDDASVVNNGVTGDVSFDASNPIAEATYIGVLGIGALAAVTVDNSFTNSGDRVGILDTNTDVTGTLNDDVPAHSFSYPANAFGDAEKGELILEFNGVEVRAIDLTTAGAVNDGAATTGFNISDKAPCEFSNGDTFTAFQYRTGTYRIDSLDMRLGWNYARVIHRIDGVDTVTNYVDWVVDGNVVDTVYSGDVFDNLVMSGSSYLSGVQYYTDGNADYDITIDHGQRNTYIATDAIQFIETNGSVPNVSFNITAGVETRTEILTDQTFTIDSNIRLLNEDITCRTTVNRTIDANEGNDPSTLKTIASILMDDLIDHTAIADSSENFNGEGYRLLSNFSITSTSYASGPGNGPVVWDYTQHMADADAAGYNDGLLVYGGGLRYPTQAVLSGDFRSVADGGSITYAPSTPDNPNYSAGTTGNRTYICYFIDATTTHANFRFNFTVNAPTTFVKVSTGVSGNNLTCELLAPNTTQNGSGTIEWKDMAEAYVTEDGIGCFASTYGATIPTAWGVSLGPRNTFTSGNAIVVKITASSSWTGSIDNITCTFSP